VVSVCNCVSGGLCLCLCVCGGGGWLGAAPAGLGSSLSISGSGHGFVITIGGVVLSDGNSCEITGV